jgi:hypothetical protein
LLEKVRAKKIELINTVKCAGLTEGMNTSVESRHVLHVRPSFPLPKIYLKCGANTQDYDLRTRVTDTPATGRQGQFIFLEDLVEKVNAEKREPTPKYCSIGGR